VVSVCVATGGMGVFIGAQGRFPRVRRGESEEVEHRVAATWPAG
jgi:hypothetical protein